MGEEASPAAGPTRLNPYAERVRRHLVAAFPGHAEEITVDDHGDLRLEIECPARLVDAGLWISTWNEDVVVGFHTHHAHFSDWERSGTDDHIDAGIETARDVLAERLVVVSWYSREEVVLTQFREPDGTLDALRGSELGRSSWLARRRFPKTGWLPTDISLFVRGVESTVRSWRGTHNMGRAGQGSPT